jgi:cation diffusion facilitator family transporter
MCADMGGWFVGASRLWMAVRYPAVVSTDEHHHDREPEEPHDHGPSDPEVSWVRRLRHQVGHLFQHDHDHGLNTGLLETGEIGIHATKVSLVGLGITALLQAIIVVFSGSVALLSDTLHNITDALTAIPLWIAFAVGMRPATRRYTYGFKRAEDAAGFLIVIAIGVSAALVIWESVQRLFEPRLINHIPWVIAAGIIGALGNEFVARYRIRIGHEIGSEALITDGHHARSDALTSLAVVAAGIGAAFGAEWVDPIAGLVVASGILWLLIKSGRKMARRLLDGIEPELVEDAATAIESVDGVIAIDDLRVRWHGHQLHIAASVAVAPDLTVEDGHDIAHNVEHELHHRFSSPIVAIIHIEPYEHTDSHETVAHHTLSDRP